MQITRSSVTKEGYIQITHFEVHGSVNPTTSFSHTSVVWTSSQVFYLHIFQLYNLSNFIIRFLLPLDLYAEFNTIWYGICLWSVGVRSVSVSVQLLGHPLPAHCWSAVRSRKGLDSVWALLRNNWNIHVLATSFFNTDPKCSPVPATVNKINCIPIKSSIMLLTIWNL